MKEQCVRVCARYRKRNKKNVGCMIKRVEWIDLTTDTVNCHLKISVLRACGNVHGQSSFAMWLLPSAVIKTSKWSSQDWKQKSRRCQQQETRLSKPRLASVLVLILWKYCIVDSLASQEKIWISSHFFVSWFAFLALTVTGGCSLNPNIKI